MPIQHLWHMSFLMRSRRMVNPREDRPRMSIQIVVDVWWELITSTSADISVIKGSITFVIALAITDFHLQLDKSLEFDTIQIGF